MFEGGVNSARRASFEGSVLLSPVNPPEVGIIGLASWAASLAAPHSPSWPDRSALPVEYAFSGTSLSLPCLADDGVLGSDEARLSFEGLLEGRCGQPFERSNALSGSSLRGRGGPLPVRRTRSTSVTAPEFVEDSVSRDVGAPDSDSVNCGDASEDISKAVAAQNLKDKA